MKQNTWLVTPSKMAPAFYTILQQQHSCLTFFGTLLVGGYDGVLRRMGARRPGSLFCSQLPRAQCSSGRGALPIFDDALPFKKKAEMTLLFFTIFLRQGLISSSS